MANSQPLNTSISVFQRLRTVRNNGRHTSIKHLTTPFDEIDIAVPGHETQVVETRDTAFKSDAFQFGHPICVLPRTPFSITNLYNDVAGVDFPVRMVGNLREIQVQLAGVANSVGNSVPPAVDFFGEVRTAEQNGTQNPTVEPAGLTLDEGAYAAAPAGTAIPE